jgi:hypothetical protein
MRPRDDVMVLEEILEAKQGRDKNIQFILLLLSSTILLTGITMMGLPFFFLQPVFAQNGGWTEYSRLLVADTSVHIAPDNFQYFPFYAVAPVNVLTGYYEELSARELMVTVYDASTCNVPYGSYGFDITTCMTIDANLYNEIQAAGRPSINLYPGLYFLTVEGANYEDVAVNIYFELVGYVANGGSMPQQQISPPPSTTTEEEEPDDGSGLNRCLITPNYGPWILSPPVCY